MRKEVLYPCILCTILSFLLSNFPPGLLNEVGTSCWLFILEIWHSKGFICAKCLGSIILNNESRLAACESLSVYRLEYILHCASIWILLYEQILLALVAFFIVAVIAVYLNRKRFHLFRRYWKILIIMYIDMVCVVSSIDLWRISFQYWLKMTKYNVWRVDVVKRLLVGLNSASKFPHVSNRKMWCAK